MEQSSRITSDTVPLGVVTNGTSVFLYHTIEQEEKFFQADISTDGFVFSPKSNGAKIVDEKRRNVNPHKSQDFRISKVGDRFVLLFKYRKEKNTSTYVATSKDLVRFQRLGKASNIKENGVIVGDFEYQGGFVMYTGEKEISLAVSNDLISWNLDAEPVLSSHNDFFGEFPVHVAYAGLAKDGILVLYYVTKENSTIIQAALFDKNDPRKLLRSYNEPIWESPADWHEKKAYPVGLLLLDGTYLSYWISDSDGLFAISHPQFTELGTYEKSKPAFLLNKLKNNPIIKPIVDHFWESRAVFNPGAVVAEGRVHMLYRAIGNEDVSVLGYASSEDGIHFDERLDAPAYVPTESFESSSPYTGGSAYSPFASGGGCSGGCEDPRLTKIDDKIYMTYVAYNGWSEPRVALSSISVKDFVSHNWNWQKPVLISRPGQVNKNACLLPKKVNGKYVLFHRIFPHILVDYLDDLDFDGETKWLVGHDKISPRRGYWDSRKVGVGATPLDTPYGWLLIYQAVGDQDSGRYKMGAMLLDKANPAHVLHRSVKPILEPTEWYENDGFKAGVAYPCGSAIVGNRLHVYYGGADMVTCIATAPLDDFMDHLMHDTATTLTPITGKAIEH
jgi:predicted GH43/DUF377 family glycosyl hydrolase